MPAATDTAPDLCEQCYGLVSTEDYRWAVLTLCSCGTVHLSWVHAACRAAWNAARAAL